MYFFDSSSYQPSNIVDLVDSDANAVRATLGTSFVDPHCDIVYQAAKKKNHPRAFYHFATVKGSARKQAKWFIDNTKGYFGEAVPVLDFEVAKNKRFVKKFVRCVYKREKVHPWIYASTHTIKTHDLEKLATKENCMLWEARWINGTNVGWQKVEPTVSPSWARQYTSHGRVGRYNGRLDLDYSSLTKKQWQAYATGDRDKIKKEDKVKKSEATKLKKQHTADTKTISELQKQLRQKKKELDGAIDDLAELKQSSASYKAQSEQQIKNLGATLTKVQKMHDKCQKDLKKQQKPSNLIKQLFNWIKGLFK